MKRSFIIGMFKFKCGGKELLKRHLNECIAPRQMERCNSWQFALLRALGIWVRRRDIGWFAAALSKPILRLRGVLEMNASVREIDMLMKVAEKVSELLEYLNSEKLNKSSTEMSYWYSYITQIKKILGNLDNDVSYIACLMAKVFLCKKHSLNTLDVAAKPQSAPGLDIDEITIEGDRVIAEIKTTIPYGETDLGSQQKETFYKDFKKLQNNEAAYKYFFVTELRTFEIVNKRYLSRLEGVSVVLLPQALSELDNNCVNELSSAATMKHKTVMENHKPIDRAGSRSIINKGLADRIRKYINREILQHAREAGFQQIIVKSADISSALKLTSRYPAICSAMEGTKMEKDYGVQILIKEGTYGAKYIVTYEL